MTKQKKFKERVRARMAETGERYTEAHAKEHDPSSVKATAQAILHARETRDMLEFYRAIKAFHRAVENPNTPSSYATLGSHILEIMWPPPDSRAPSWDRRQGPHKGLSDLQKLQDDIEQVLTQYKEGNGTLPDAVVWDPWVKHPYLVSPVSSFYEHRKTLPTPEEGVVYDPKDDAFYDLEASPPSVEGLVIPEGDFLQDMLWEFAPDVSTHFGLATESSAHAELRRLRALLYKHGIDPSS